MLRLPWRFLDSGATDGITNMATDAALLAYARRSGEAVLRVYAWSRPTLSLGRHERARGLFSGEALAAAQVEVVRRPTGGRALLHDREVTYSVAAPIGEATLAASYTTINALLAEALGRLGVVAVPAVPTRRPLRPEGAACFAEPGAGELIVNGAKLVGSAQLREDGALLQHGSILLDDDQARIAGLRCDDARQVSAAPAATLNGTLGRSVHHGEVRDALRDALASRATLVGTLSDASLQDDLARLVGVFADPAWTWRR